jgi:hypothetical protein
MVVDGIEGPVFDKIVPGSFRFSESSKHFAYAARRGAKLVILKDSKEVLEGDDVLRAQQARKVDFVFLSPDGKRLASMVRRGNQWFAVVDGIESQPWDWINDLGGLAGACAGFSPDGGHFSYVGFRGGKKFVVVDNKESADGWMGCAVFSPDGKHAALVRARERGGRDLVSCVVLDGMAGKEFKGVIEDLVFSPDGTKLAYRVQEWHADEYVVIHGGDLATSSVREVLHHEEAVAGLTGRLGAFAVYGNHDHYTGDLEGVANRPAEDVIWEAREAGVRWVCDDGSAA